MSKNIVAVLDVGSSKLRVCVGRRGVNNNFIILSNAETDYAGFLEGEFLQMDKLKNDITTTINKAQINLKNRISKIYVGVPADFCVVRERKFERTFKNKTVITKRVLDDMFLQESDNDDKHSVLSKSPIYYMLDDNKKRLDVLNETSEKLVVNTSVVLAEKYFIETIEKILYDLKINEHVFLSSNLCQGVYLLNGKEKEKDAVVIDAGYISTAVFSFKNEGIIDIASFSMGGGFITSDLSEILKLTFEQAGKLKSKVILSVKPTAMDYYELFINGSPVKIDAKTATDIVLARIDLFVDTLQKVLSKFVFSEKSYDTIYLTGGGLSYLKGIKYYLSKALSKKVKILTAEPLQLSKPSISSLVSLLSVALNLENK